MSASPAPAPTPAPAPSAAPPQESAGPKKAKKKAAFFLELGLFVLLPAAAGVGFAAFGIPREAASAPPAAPGRGSAVFELPTLIVNLAGSRGQRYLKVGLAIQVRASDPEAAKAKFAENQAPLRDALIALLSSKTLERVDSPEEKEAIKLEILDLLNRSIFSDRAATAERLYFQEFIVQ
jgi:flagellar FliL protein